VKPLLTLLTLLALSLASGEALHAQDEQAEPDPLAEIADQARQRWESLQDRIGTSCGRDSHCDAPLRCVQAVCAEPGAMSGVPTDSTPFARFRTEAGVALYYLELAVAPPERNRGLMYRPWIRPDWGMLFVFPNEQPLSFWMQNTFIPLDMVFVNSEGVVVGVLENVPPLTTESRAVDGLSRYVIELEAGQAAASGIAAGTVVEMLNLPEGVL